MPAGDGTSVSSPSLADALPDPSLTSARLRAALSQGLGWVPFESIAGDPRFAWLAGLSGEPVFCSAARLVPGRPAVVLAASPEEDAGPKDPAGQVVLRRVLERLPEPVASRLLTTGFPTSADLGALRRQFPSPLRRDLADFLLHLGIFSAAHHWALTAPFSVRLETKEVPEELSRFRNSLAFRARGRAAVAVYARALERSLEPIEQRTLDLELWALERARAAFQSGEISLPDYLDRLLKEADSEGSSRQARRLVDLQALGEGLDFNRAREERDRLSEIMNSRLSGPRRAELLRATQALAENRLSPSRHARKLLDLASGAGVSAAADHPAFFQFSRHIELAEEIDASALMRELAGLEAVVFGGPRNGSEQAGLLALAEDLRRIARAAETGDVPSETPWDAWKTIVSRAEALARRVDLDIPRPSFPWEDAVSSLALEDEALDRRARAIVRETLSLPPAGEAPLLLAPRALVPALEEAFRREGAAVAVLRPLWDPGAAPPTDGLVQVWNLPRLAWDGGEAQERLTAALCLALASVFAAARGEPPRSSETALKRFRVRVVSGRPRKLKNGGELRTTIYAAALRSVALRWRWLPAPAEGGAGPGFVALGDFEAGGPQQLFVRAEPGFRGPLKWVAAQGRAMRAAVRRFFRMQGRAALLAGAWMTGGVTLSFFAGVVSTALIAAWMAVGVVVLAGVVLLGQNASVREEWGEGLRTWREKRRALAERLRAWNTGSPD